jgi:hypothetical protein
MRPIVPPSSPRKTTIRSGRLTASTEARSVTRSLVTKAGLSASAVLTTAGCVQADKNKAQEMPIALRNGLVFGMCFPPMVPDFRLLFNFVVIFCADLNVNLLVQG